jgi:hypothetical protein
MARANDPPADETKSIAVPVTRRSAVKPRRAGHPQSAPDQVVGGQVGPPRAPAREFRPTSKHRYHVGQRLRLLGGGSAWSRSGGACKVIAQMPSERGTFHYRVRSEVESFERVVAEADLAPIELI